MGHPRLNKRQMDVLDLLQVPSMRRAKPLGDYFELDLPTIKRTLEQLQRRGLIRIDLDGWQIETKTGAFDILPQWRKR